MGTPAFAAHILDYLVTADDARFAVTMVVTRPDEPRGRGMKPRPSEVGVVAERRHLPVIKPVKIRDATFLNEIESRQPDLIVVAAYGRILPDAVLAAARVAPINVHASLLPRYRGAAPVEGAILAGETQTGVTILRITAKMDAGPTVLSHAIPIAPDDTQGILKDKLANLGAAALIEALDLYARGTAVETPQDESRATFTKPIRKQDALIDWNADAAAIERMTRAYDPWPVARTSLAGAPILLWRARVDDSAIESADAPAGTLIAVRPDPIVRCGRGALVLVQVQAAGRRRMSAADFLNGRRVEAGARLGT